MDRVRRQSAIQALAYTETFPSRLVERVTPMMDLAKPTMWDSVLDVACGWGLVSLAFAPHARSVTGVDLTPEMLELAKKVATQKGVSNVEFQIGDVENLKFDPGSFDIVTCRAALDHFSGPEKALREMKRVLSPSGRIVLYEFVAPADLEKAHFYHQIETSRDPSHLWSSSIHDFEALFIRCGLEERGRVINLLKRDFDAWMSSGGTDKEGVARTRELIERTIPGDRAGLGPRIRGGKLGFTQTCVAWLLVPQG